ncbi:MAG: MFS transporter [Candidatus Marsarchaeota archaeon]|nr:MFS transporter [Candidatus Marsarchaeota archaeon]MCL5105811.1 MFS transporter [Candidatus Marsarchaeota archaeon]
MHKFFKDGISAKTVALGVVLIGVLMAAIDTTIVILALPTIDLKLGTSPLASIWVILAYILVLAAFSSQVGKLGDMLGRARLYKYGLAVFILGSALCGLSPNIDLLIGSRILQAFGGVLIGTISSAVIADHFEPRERGRAFGYTAIGWNFGAILGIFLGGFLTTIDWRWIFFINLPIGAVVIPVAVYKLRDVVKPKKERFDLIGVSVLSIGLLVLTLAAVFSMFDGLGIREIAMFAVSFVLFAVFILVERKSRFPTIDFSLFKKRIFSFSILASMFQGIASFAILFILILYLQGIRGLNPFVSSLYLLPGYALGGIVAPLMGRLSDRIGARIPATMGLLFIISAYVLYSVFLGISTPLYYIALITMLTGIGSAMFYPANTSAIMANAPKDKYSMASGLNRMLGNIGMVLSFVIALTVISAAIPRNTAFAIFMGSSISLTSAQSGLFLKGIHSVFISSMIIIAFAAIMSIIRGKENRIAVD